MPDILGPSIDAELRDAEHLAQLGRFAEARAIYDQLIADHPDDWRVRLGLARLLADRGEMAEADAELAVALASDPEEPALLAERARLRLAAGDTEAAEADLRCCIARAPEDANYRVKLATLLLQQGAEDEARTHCQEALKWDPNHKGVHHILGGLAWESGDLKAAAEHLLITRQPPNVALDPNATLASCLFAIGRTPEIVKLSSPKSGEQRYLETVLRTIFNWQTGRLEICEQLRATAGGLYGRIQETANVRALRQIEGLIKSLIEALDDDPSNYQGKASQSFFLIGDSQALPPAHLFARNGSACAQVVSHYVINLTAGDLAAPFQNPSARNPAAAALQSALALVPSGWQVIFSAGAMDLRYQGGLFDRLKADPGLNLHDEAASLVEGYVATTSALCRELNLKPGYLVPPPPNIPMRRILTEDRGPFITLIASFSNSLRQAAQAEGALLADLSKAALGEDGRPAPEAYLDNYHLRPNRYLQALSPLLASVEAGQ